MQLAPRYDVTRRRERLAVVNHSAAQPTVFRRRRGETIFYVGARRSSLLWPWPFGETGETKYTTSKFGRRLQGLRRARGLTQEALAERSGLSSDSIRRLERGAFAPTLATLEKVCKGLDIAMSTLFEGMEREAPDEIRELCDLLRSCSRRDQRVAVRVVRALLAD